LDQSRLPHHRIELDRDDFGQLCRLAAFLSGVAIAVADWEWFIGGVDYPLTECEFPRMKRKKALVEKTSVGTADGVKYRARCNDLPDNEREKLNDEFLKLYYAGSISQPARRR
jgi:hypothetical protein